MFSNIKEHIEVYIFEKQYILQGKRKKSMGILSVLIVVKYLGLFE